MRIFLFQPGIETKKAFDNLEDPAIVNELADFFYRAYCVIKRESGNDSPSIVLPAGPNPHSPSPEYISQAESNIAKAVELAKNKIVERFGGKIEDIKIEAHGSHNDVYSRLALGKFDASIAFADIMAYLAVTIGGAVEGGSIPGASHSITVNLKGNIVRTTLIQGPAADIAGNGIVSADNFAAATETAVDKARLILEREIIQEVPESILISL